MARCYKDTILIMITQRFEMITKAYETSHIKPSKNYRCLPLKKLSSVLVLLLLKCGLGLKKTPQKTNYFPFYMGHAIPRQSLPGNEGWTMT